MDISLDIYCLRVKCIWALKIIGSIPQTSNFFMNNKSYQSIWPCVRIVWVSTHWMAIVHGIQMNPKKITSVK